MTMEELKYQAKNLRSELDRATSSLGLKKLEIELAGLQSEMKQPDFWQYSQKAQFISKQEAVLRTRVEPWQKIHKNLNDCEELLKLEDKTLEDELQVQLEQLGNEFKRLKKYLRFSGPYDDHNVILSIYAGAGGTDAQDWAQMLLRMYTRWAEDQGLKAEILDQSAGEEAGIKSVSLKLSSGNFLYGKLAGEHGVHRMVRKSPFNSAGSRETSFAKVDVLPLVDKPGEVVIDEKDLKTDVFRSGGAGGQSVNTTDSAVRVTHLPTGIAVAIQNERSQLQNKETAMSILRSRLVALQLEQHAEKLADLKGPSQAAEFGSQIRNYILDDRIVKDLRTGYETHDPQKVLDGNLNPLIDAWLER